MVVSPPKVLVATPLINRSGERALFYFPTQCKHITQHLLEHAIRQRHQNDFESSGRVAKRGNLSGFICFAFAQTPCSPSPNVALSCKPSATAHFRGRAVDHSQFAAHVLHAFLFFFVHKSSTSCHQFSSAQSSLTLFPPSDEPFVYSQL